LNGGVRNEAAELIGVDGLAMGAIQAGVYVGSEGNAEGIVRVDPDHARIVAYEPIQLFGVAEGNIVRREPALEQASTTRRPVGTYLAVPSALTSTCVDQPAPIQLA